MKYEELEVLFENSLAFEIEIPSGFFYLLWEEYGGKNV